MLNDFKYSYPVYLACGYTDLRRIDGLAGLVQARFRLGPFQNALFCGQRRSICCPCTRNCTSSW